MAALDIGSTKEDPRQALMRIKYSRWLTAFRTPLGMTAGTLLAAFLLLAVVAPILWTKSANAVNVTALLQGPTTLHLLGTDGLGRDVFYRVLVATRLSMELALGATGLGLGLGLIVGVLPVFLGRRFANCVIGGTNLALSFPFILLILFFAVIFGVGETGALVSVGIAYAPVFARLTQTLAAGIENKDYVIAARLVGVSRVRLATRHILPNIGETLIVNATISAGGVLLSFAALSFLGLGIQPPQYDWGELLNQGASNLYLHPAAALGPGVMVVLASLAFNLTGEALAKRLGVELVTRRGSSGVSWSKAAELVEQRRRLRSATRGVVRLGEQTAEATLAVEGLRVGAPGRQREAAIVRGISLAIGPGEAVGIVGESGSGKTQTALAIAQLLEYPLRVVAERLEFLGTDLLGLKGTEMRQFLGTSMAMVFQDPLSSLNPRLRVGQQLAELSRHHQSMSRRQAWARSVDRLHRVGIGEPERRAKQLPHEFSGGMRQRAVIGMGLMGEPQLIIADEPTTALDVTVQRRVLSLLEAIRVGQRCAVLLISHDIALVEHFCDRVLVMYAGRIVEEIPAGALRSNARHPYSRALLATAPNMATDRDRPLATIAGKPARPSESIQGCAFAPRCSLVVDRCRTEEPSLVNCGSQHRVACWRADEDPPGLPANPRTGTRTTRDGSSQAKAGGMP